ncbi:glycosyl transferase-like sugar-binding protein [Allofrancisella inopinata]|uniref:Glycosyl transferase-like sugar-binding protein n=1 Tax=Allofrancisella inopinata TaxID=1085647 RepID=A0AAE6YJ14_9GAMM|nr:glycosyltransferase [Allofrancisella inopinata]QIV95649.1 hypothetical protein E4K63_01905 [Allofrancisella inopinata]TDT67478.1 glycosyl transferase-like sugar-binding protein [Allofrancisella inopinata]
MLDQRIFYPDKERWDLKKEVEDRFKWIPVIVVNFESYLSNLGETPVETENFRFMLEIYKLCNKPYYYAFVKDHYILYFLANFGGLYFDIDFLPLKEIYPTNKNFCFILVKYCNVSDKDALISKIRRDIGSIIEETPIAGYDVGFKICFEPIREKKPYQY